MDGLWKAWGGEVEAEPMPAGGPDMARLDRARDALAGRLREKGLAGLVVSDDWTALEAVNRQNLGSWFTLMPRPASAPTMWLGAVDAGGEVIATQGAYLLDCEGTSFGNRLADLSAFYDPGTAPADAWCFCASEGAYVTWGRVAFVVAGWVRPDWRGRGLFHPMAFLVRLLAWARWDVQRWCGLVDPETVPVWSARGSGKRLLEARPGVLLHQPGVGRLPLRLLAFSRPGVVLDVKCLLHGPLLGG